MSVGTNNFDRVIRAAPRGPSESRHRFQIHKHRKTATTPKVSLILLDWECRERFDTLDWLLRQQLPKEQYELIWIELRRRIVPEAIEKADVVITCEQSGLYQKHVGYNIGLLVARGEIITICDSDAVFPPDFVQSIVASFDQAMQGGEPSLVLMHYQWRTAFLYPEDLADTSELRSPRWRWWPLHPNVGACMSVRRADAIRFGGFDEHKSYRGYLCGPYELGWRMVNAGIPERWHDPSVALWHFAHPDPVGTNGLARSLRTLLEIREPHVDLHAIRAVEAFSTGRLLPLVENPAIREARLKSRRIGTKFEEKYAWMTGPRGFSRLHVVRLRLELLVNLLARQLFRGVFLPLLRKFLPERVYSAARSFYHRFVIGSQPPPAGVSRPEDLPSTGRSTEPPQLVCSIAGFNLVSYDGRYIALPQRIGSVDLERQAVVHPEIIVVDSREQAEAAIAAHVQAVPIEYLGWLPPYATFGGCGTHPLFRHLRVPPHGYRFQARGADAQMAPLPPRRRPLTLRRIARLVIDAVVVTPPRLIRSVTSAARLARAARRNGAGWRATWDFIRSRDFSSQLKVPEISRLALLPSVPYTLGQHPWMIEIEDTTSLFFPFVHNGETKDWSVDDCPAYPIVKALLEGDACRGILTHVRSTAESLPRLFRNETLQEKVFFQPLGIDLTEFPPVERSVGSPPRLLFTNSWHQNPQSFYVRGGLDLLRAVDLLWKENLRVPLTIRSALPEGLEPEFCDIIDRCGVEVVDRFLTREEYLNLLRESDVYVLPAARIHVVSILEAMASGMALVVSDGWAVDEYVQHGHSGLVVRGRHGKVSWLDSATGILREDYAPLMHVDENVARGVANAVAQLDTDTQMRQAMGKNAREAVATRFSLEEWNKGLGRTLDQVLSRQV